MSEEILKELEKGKWPSYVTEIRKAGYEGLLKVYGKALEDKMTHFIHGGMVGVKGYDAGVIGRMTDMPDVMKTSHLLRVIPPAGWFYTTEALRKICDIWDKYGSGVINFHGATANLQLVGIETEKIEDCFNELVKLGWDLGGSGPDFRTPAACLGPAYCEFAMIDTLDIYHEIVMSYIEDIHLPMHPYKFKVKIAGCPNDCVAAGARADLAIIGTWRDNIKIDQEKLKEYPEEVIKRAVERCPTQCMKYENGKLEINDEECNKCMYCINLMPKALRVGDDRGATILIGARARGRIGSFLGWVLIPFMKLEKPYKELKDLIKKLLDWWDEVGNPKERIGEAIYRIGMGKFLRDVGIEPVPQMIYRPRANPFWYYWPGEVE